MEDYLKMIIPLVVGFLSSFALHKLRPKVSVGDEYKEILEANRKWRVELETENKALKEENKTLYKKIEILESEKAELIYKLQLALRKG